MLPGPDSLLGLTTLRLELQIVRFVEMDPPSARASLLSTLRSIAATPRGPLFVNMTFCQYDFLTELR